MSNSKNDLECVRWFETWFGIKSDRPCSSTFASDAHRRYSGRDESSLGVAEAGFFLARKEPKRPTRASLRRSVSASYYAAFHPLVEEATRFTVSSKRDHDSLRNSLTRAFQHSAMKQTARAFAEETIPSKLSSGSERESIQPSLIAFASAFVELQDARHDADYNRFRRFTRQEALDPAELADRAFRDWKQVRGGLRADAFLTGLLAYRHMRG